MLFTLSACDFALFSNSRQLVGDYYLLQWEDFQTYYIEDKQKTFADQPGGAIDGTVLEIGWDSNTILINRKGVVGGDGWIAIDVNSRTILGPLKDFDKSANTKLSKIKTVTAQEAWTELCKNQFLCW